MIRACLLEHRGHGPRHYDLVIGRGTRCPTLRLEAGRRWSITWSFPHRRRYLTFNGPVGGGRGVVCRRWVGVVRLTGRWLQPVGEFPLGLRIVPLPAAASCRP